MIAGVLAIAASAIGAKFASWSRQPKLGSRISVTASSASVSSSANPKL